MNDEGPAKRDLIGTKGKWIEQTRPNRRELVQRFGLQHLEVIDESHGHNVPDGAESHFKIVAVSEEFAGKRLIQRHRMINELLASEFAGGMHALAIHVYTAERMANPVQSGADVASLCRWQRP